MGNWTESHGVETINSYATADEADFSDEAPVHEKSVTAVYATFQASDWRDAIDVSPKSLDGHEIPLVMN